MEAGSEQEQNRLDLDDPNLEEKLVNELKAQGVFDQFRKDCLSDVDTKPAYHNLRVRVERGVNNYLDRTTWRSTLNKNQLRNQLRKYIQEMGGVEAGVDRIVDQIVDPRIMETKVENVIYTYFGTSKEAEEAKEKEALENGLLQEEEDEEEDAKEPEVLENGNSEHVGEGAAATVTSRPPSADGVIQGGSQGSSPAPGAVSPLTPRASPSVPQGDISPITPPRKNDTPPAPEEMDVDSPERPPSAYTPPPRPLPQQSYTPPPQPPCPALPPPPPPQADSGGEASMSSISDTDLGDISPPQPRRAPLPAPPVEPPAQPTPPPAPPAPSEGGSQGSEGKGSDDDISYLEKMKAELMAQLDEDFKLSPEESESDGEDDDPAVPPLAPPTLADSRGGSSTSPNQLQLLRTLPLPRPGEPPVPGQPRGGSEEPSPAALALSPRSPSASPSPPPEQRPPSPPHRRSPLSPPPLAPPPEAALSSLSLGETTPPGSTPPTKGCKPYPGGRGGSGSSPEDEGGAGRGGRQSAPHLAIPLPPLPPPAQTQSTSTPSTPVEGGDQKKTRLSSASSSSSSSSSKHREKRPEKKADKIKEELKAKMDKTELLMKSKDRLKSDKYQDLDIFSKTKTPTTPYQPHRLPGQNPTTPKSGSTTPKSSSGRSENKHEFSRKLTDSLGKVEREGKEEREKNRSDFKKPGKVEDRRRSSSSSDKGKEKDRRHSSSSSHKDKEKHRHEKERERRPSKEERRGSDEERKEVKEAGSKDKYEKERELQAVESKKRLQESREKKEKEARDEKERRRQKDKERKEREKRHEKEREARKEKEKKEQLDRDKSLVTEKISSLDRDTLKMVLLESLAVKDGKTLDDSQKKDILSKLESVIEEKVERKERKEPVVDSSDDDFVPRKTKKPSPGKPKLRPTPRPKRSVSSSSSDDSDDSDEGLRALKTRIAESQRRRKSTEGNTESEVKRTRPSRSPKPPKSPKKLVQEATPKKVKTPKAKASAPVVERQVPVNPAKPEADPDPSVGPLEAFRQEDIEFMLRIKDQYTRKLEGGEEAVSVSDVNSIELNSAIPAGRTVTVEVGAIGPEVLSAVSPLGGSPRLLTPPPSWLVSYLPSYLRPEQVEMPSQQEVARHTAKKNKGTKRKAGWDIVVEVVPNAPQAKRSKLEKQLGFDNDSAFGNIISSSGGRRSRRPNQRYSDGADVLTEAEAATEATPAETATEDTVEVLQADVTAEYEATIAVKEAETTTEKAESDTTVQEPNTSDEAFDAEAVTQADNTAAAEVPAEPMEVEEEAISEILEKAEDEEILEKAEDDTRRNRSRSSCGSCETVESWKEVEDEEEPPLSLEEEGCPPPPIVEDVKEKKTSLVTELVAADKELNGVMRTLRTKRRSKSGEAWHGWGVVEEAPRTGYSLLGEAEMLDSAGATFGMENRDLLPLMSGEELPSLLEVVMSPPMLQDMKRVERQAGPEVPQVKQRVALPDSDQEERGSQSPSSFGSAKENVPEICNAVSSKFTPKAPLGVSSRKRRSLKQNPVLKTNTVV